MNTGPKRKKNRRNRKSSSSGGGGGGVGVGGGSMLRPNYTDPAGSTYDDQTAGWSDNFTSFERPTTDLPASIPQTSYAYNNQGNGSGHYGY